MVRDLSSGCQPGITRLPSRRHPAAILPTLRLARIPRNRACFLAGIGGYSLCQLWQWELIMRTNSENLSRNTRRAVAKYGEAACREAYTSHTADGEGASTVGFGLGLTTGQADAAINAGRELVGDLTFDREAS